MKKSKHSKCVTMFRKLKNYKFLNSFGRSSQVNLEVFSRSIRWKSSESCNENDVPVVGSNLRYEKRPSNDCSAYRCTNVPGDWNQPYLTNQSRSHTVEGAVGAILSSPNADNEIEKLPPIRDMPCDDLIEMLIKFDDAGLPTHCRIMNTLLEEITDQAKNNPQAVSLHAMVNLTIFANKNRRKLNKYFLCVDILEPLLQRLGSCSNLEEFHKITVCLSFLNRIITHDLMEVIKTKVEVLLKSGQLNSNSDKAIILAISRFLNLAPWSFTNGPTLRKVLELLLPRIDELTDKELADVLSHYEIHYEPGAIVPQIVQLAEKRIEQSPSTDSHNICLLYCCSMTEIPEKAERILNCLNEYLDSSAPIMDDSFLYKMLRKNRISAKNVYDKYWSRMTNELAAMDPKQTIDYDNMLAKACFRYANFQNTQRDEYRYLPFEQIAKKLAIEEIETGMSGMVPQKFVKLAAFFLGYGGHPVTQRFPENFVKRIEDMARQYTIHDIAKLSRGVQIFYTRGNCKPSKSMRSRMYNDISNQMCRVENILDEHIERYTHPGYKLVVNLNKCLYIYSVSHMTRRTTIFENLIKSFEEAVSDDNLILSSRIIRDVSHNLSRMNYVLPEVCGKIMHYLYENRSMVCGGIVTRTLHTLYSIGYEPADYVLLPHDEQSTPAPQQQEVRFDEFGAIMERDFEVMSGLSIVRGCLALAFYRALSIDLIERVFNLDFITRLEKEISVCYASPTYSKRSLNVIMQLNRAVCFAYPEARIPWFQQSYVEAHIKSIVPKNSKFHDDISKMLISFVGDKSLIETNHVTPYGYRIPFVLYFNSNKELVRPPLDKNTQELTKFAIIPLEHRSYTFDTKTPRGEEQLQERHLGILGYNVIKIFFDDWNKMHMSLPGEKVTFLRKILKT